MEPATTLDPAKSEGFAALMIDQLNKGFLTFLLSIGHRTRLFDTLAALAPSTSAEIADAAGLNERYVREWLSAMACAGVLDYEPARQTFALPPEHAAYLTRAAGPDNFAMFLQYAAEVGKAEDLIVEAFRTGRGVPYSAYPKIQHLHREESLMMLDGTLLDGIVPLVDGLRARLESGIDVLDIGCGAGHAMNLLATTHPQSRFAGYDLSPDGIELARAESAALGVRNARFEVRDCAALDEPERYDVVMAFDAVHDQARPQAVLDAVHRALRPGGTLVMVEIAASSRLENNLDNPLGTFLYCASTLYCMSVSLAYGGEGLGTAWGEERAREMLAAAGFGELTVRPIAADPMHAVYAARRA